MLPTLINGAIGYLVGTSIAVIGLYIAFALPIYLRDPGGRRDSSAAPGTWARCTGGSSPLAVIWIVGHLHAVPDAGVSPKGMPGADDFDWTVVNYAPLTVGGVLLLFGGWYGLLGSLVVHRPRPGGRLGCRARRDRAFTALLRQARKPEKEA